jgi:GNAT superfamily N-acetyltransferase
VTGRGGAGGGLEVRPVSAEDLEAELDLRVRAFGPLGGYRERVIADDLDSMAAGQMLGAYEGGRLIGTARYLDTRQWWGGRSMPMAGVAGVKTAPEARGRGVATALLTELLSLLPGRGYPISVLYPSTPGVYRSLGWEFGGGFYRTEIAGPALASLLPPDSGAGGGSGAGSSGGEVRLRRAGAADAAEAFAVMSAVFAASRDCGPSTFGVDDLRRDLGDDELFSYLTDDGFLSYGFDGSSRAIEVSYFAAGSAATAKALWGILGSHSTVTKTLTAFVGPHNPVGWLTRGLDLETRVHERWMLRVVDPVAAIAARGFPAAVGASADLRLTDVVLPGNSGDYRLTVADGTGSLAKTADAEADGVQAGAAGPGGSGLGGSGLGGSGLGGSGAGGSGAGGSGAGGSGAGGSGPGGPLALGARGFAALFAGTPVSTLRVAGLASGGDPVADAAIDAAFACTPFMTDSF